MKKIAAIALVAIIMASAAMAKDTAPPAKQPTLQEKYDSEHLKALTLEFQLLQQQIQAAQTRMQAISAEAAPLLKAEQAKEDAKKPADAKADDKAKKDKK